MEEMDLGSLESFARLGTVSGVLSGGSRRVLGGHDTHVSIVPPCGCDTRIVWPLPSVPL